MTNIIQRVINWNAQRYEQQSNMQLSLALLDEEFLELRDSDSMVEGFDAVGDILFVAIGALWKLGCTAEDIEACYLQLINDKEYAYNITVECTFNLLNSGSLLLTKTTDEAVLVCTIVNYMSIAIQVLRACGRLHQANAIMDAICTSNETKQVPAEKSNSAVKANAGRIGKGPNYVSPTAALTKLVEEME